MDVVEIREGEWFTFVLKRDCSWLIRISSTRVARSQDGREIMILRDLALVKVNTLKYV